jgi:hypothetical protein
MLLLMSQVTLANPDSGMTILNLSNNTEAWVDNDGVAKVRFTGEAAKPLYEYLKGEGAEPQKGLLTYKNVTCTDTNQSYNLVCTVD